MHFSVVLEQDTSFCLSGKAIQVSMLCPPGKLPVHDWVESRKEMGSGQITLSLSEPVSPSETHQPPGSCGSFYTAMSCCGNPAMALPLHGCDSQSFLTPDTLLWEGPLPCSLGHLTNRLAQARELQPTQVAGLGAPCPLYHSGHSL